MLPEKIMQSDLLDILFENKNKNYGAYALRKSYNKTLIIAITITLFIAMVFSVFQFIHHKKQGNYMAPFIFLPEPQLIKIDEVKPEKVQPLQRRAAGNFNQKIFTPPVIVNNITETQMPTTDVIDKSIIGKINIDGKETTGDIAPPAVAKEGTGIVNAGAAEIKEETPLTLAQVMPEYPGGLEALRKFMLKNLRQPDNLQPGEKIIVRAFFIVNKDGKIEQVKILNEGRNDLNKEVQRVINKMPLWKPGRQNGNAVAVYFNLPVTFMSEE